LVETDGMENLSSRRPRRACEKCGEMLDLMTRLPRLGDQPSYDIYKCARCGALEWVDRTAGG
jgi:hypothetical protein